VQTDRDPGLVAFLVPECSTVDLAALRTFLLARLPSVAIPRRYVLVESLPHQPNGKLDHRALDRLAAGTPLRRERTG
jgi:acyl-CoA synthetase (AMP-forming)/AMP-acid ligase II